LVQSPVDRKLRPLADDGLDALDQVRRRRGDAPQRRFDRRGVDRIDLGAGAGRVVEKLPVLLARAGAFVADEVALRPDIDVMIVLDSEILRPPRFGGAPVASGHGPRTRQGLAPARY
jgi:hypothetical protein